MHERADARPDTASPIALPVGTVLAQTYRIVGLLAEPGPHAVVYRAVSSTGDEVAIKELFPRALVGRAPRSTATRPHDADAAARLSDARRRFLLEAQLLESVTHEGLPRALAHFEQNGTAYLVMQLLPGRTLEERLSTDGPIPAAEVGRLALAILDAVEVLHGHGILHRDIAPANILIGLDGRPRLLGLATPRQLLMYGMPGAIAPRAGFAAIEMYGSRGKGPWTDVHAVAALLYLLFTGSLPASAVDRAAGEGLVPPSRLHAKLSWSVDALIVKGLSQRPEERPHSAERFRTLLEEALADTRPAPAYTPASPAAHPSPAGSMTPAYAQSGITPLTLQAIAPHANLPGFALPSRAPVPLGGDELLTDDENVSTGLTLDPTGSMTVVPVPVSPVRRLLRIVGAVLALLALLALAAQAFKPSDGEDDHLLATPATAVEPARTLQTPPEPVASEAAVGAASTETPTDGSRSTSGPENPAPTARRGSRSSERRSAPPDLQLPTVKAPAITAPTTVLLSQPVPAEVVEQLRDELASARARVDAGDYAAAQRLFRGATVRLDDVAEKHLPSTTLTSLRREIDQASQRAREACAALNAIAARRNGRQLVCE